jgi:KaiC/GvpD/RAD55 family RecA-like ATPase/Zn ribbon nucleic-acid-binding protein
VVRKRKKKKYVEKEAGIFIGKTNCPSCESLDNLAVYEHEDGSHSATCFGETCRKSYVDWDYKNNKAISVERKTEYEEDDFMGVGLPTLEEVRDDRISVKLNDRKIKESVCELYGVKVELNEDGETVDRHYYPTYRKKQHVGYRVRSRFEEGDKEVEKKPKLLGVLKNFKGTIGDTKKGIELFGQHLFSPEKHKRLFITEGELDAMVGYQATEAGAQNIEGGYAFVSLPSGANIAGLKPQLEYINKFEEIYLCYDNDEAGKSILEKSLKILPAGKVRIMKYPKGIKDINDWWLSCKTKQERMNFPKKFYNNIWKSEKYSPAGIKSLSEGWGDYIQRGKETLIPFPASFGDMNKRTHGGYALGEILTIAAPSSVGKSSFVKEMIYTALTETDYNIGICSFEETLGEFIEGFLSVHMSEQLNEIPYDKRDRDKEWTEFNKLITMGKSDEEVEEEGSFADRVHYLDHQGSCDGDELLEKIDFLINGLDCKIIFVDPVTLALANTDMEEDEFTAVLVKKVKKENIAWVNIHHVRKNAGGSKANSEGGDMAEEDIKGSGSWFQTSMINMLLMRNKVHTNPIVRNTTTIKMSKCRRHGKNTGIAGYTFYNGDTGRLELGVNPEDYLDDDVDTDHTFDHEELPDSFVDEWHRGEES